MGSECLQSHILFNWGKHCWVLQNVHFIGLYECVCVCVCVCVCDLHKTMFSLLQSKFKEILCMSIFGNTCSYTQLFSLMTVSSTSYMEFDNFRTDRALGGQANQTFIF